MKKNAKKNELETLSKKESAWYVVGGVIAAFGLVLSILHLVARFTNTNSHASSLKVAETNLMEAIGIDINFLGYGLIFFAFGIFIVIIALAVNAKKTDRLLEKKLRQEQRLAASPLNLTEEGNIIEAEIAGEKVDDETTPTLTAKEQ